MFSLSNLFLAYAILSFDQFILIANWFDSEAVPFLQHFYQDSSKIEFVALRIILIYPISYLSPFRVVILLIDPSFTFGGHVVQKSSL
jgi:hypothetical protein